MDPFNQKKYEVTKNRHIKIKRKNKRLNEDKIHNLSLYEIYEPRLFNNLNNKKEGNILGVNNLHIEKITAIQRPKIKINLFSINNNNQRSVNISSEKNNKTISCKIHKSKPKKDKKTNNLIIDISKYKTNINHNSIHLEKNIFNKTFENNEQRKKNKNMSFLNYFDLIQQNNLKTLNEHLEKIVNINKIKLDKSNEKNDKTMNPKIINNINGYNNKQPKPNIYIKKPTKQKCSFSKSKTNTHTNTISDLNSFTTEQIVNNQRETEIFNQSIKNKLENKKLSKIIPKYNYDRNKYRNAFLNTYNSDYINLSSNSTSKISSISNKNYKTKKFPKKIKIDLERDDINIYKNNYFIYNYIGKDNNTFNINSKIKNNH